MKRATAAWDDIVVGGGLVGAAVARRLVEAGRRVAIAERGRAVTDPAGSHVRNTAAMQTSPDTFFADIDRYLDYIDTDVSASGLPGAFTTSVRGGVGIVWTNNCPRSIYGLDRPELPDEGEWDGYFTLAERLLDVRTDEFDDSLRQRLVAERLAPVLAEQGRRVRRLPLSGRRLEGERIHYVAAADVIGEAATEIEWLDGRVERLEMSGGRADAVRIDGETHRADNVFVAAGAVDTPALLWRSGLNPPALGRNLSFHPVLVAQIVLDPALASSGPEPDSVPRLGIAPTHQHPWFLMLLRDTNPLPIAASDRDVPGNRLIEIQAFAPVDPHPDNRMDPAADGSLTFDVPLRPADEDRRRAIVRDAEELCIHLGRFRVGCEPQWAPLGTPHLTGSCRMGRIDDGTSVTDTDGRVWGTDNVFVAGNGVIPTRIAVNPTLTATALALRTVDRAIG